MYCRADSPRSDKFETLIAILRDDGAIQRRDGSFVETEYGRIRLGTRFVVDGKRSFCVADLIVANVRTVGKDGMIRVDGGEPLAFFWEFGDSLLRPEDFVLNFSGTTLEDAYRAGE